MHISERNPKETARDYALRTLRDNIVRLELEPGSMVSENVLASEMGLSRTPVREALIELSKVKIVEILSQRGCLISLVDYALVEESCFLRTTLECAILDEVCKTASQEQLVRLQANIAMQDFYLKNQESDKLMQLDDEFHAMLFEIAGKMLTHHITESLSIHDDRIRNMALYAVKDLKVVEDHRAILQALMERNAERAAELMHRHLSRYKVEEESLRERYAGYFK